MMAAEAGRSVAQVVEIRDAAAFERMRGDWNHLLQASASDCLFLSWEWLFTWWRNLAGDRRLSILAVYDDEELIGLAPFVVSRASAAFGHPFPVGEFLGSGYAGSDYLDVIARRGLEPQVAQALAAHLRGERAVFKWTNMRSEASAGALGDGLARSGWSVERTEVNVCPYIALSGRTWDSYLSSLGSEHRYNFQRKWKRLCRDFTVRYERVWSGHECCAAVVRMIELHQMRWCNRGESDAFHTSELVAFHREFAPLALDCGWLRLHELRADDRVIASLYGFLYGGRFYFYQSGLDPAYEKYSPGLIAMGLAIRNAIGEGAREYDLLHGAEPYKFHWGAESRPLIRLELFPPGFAGRVSQASVHLARISKRLASGVLGGVR